MKFNKVCQNLEFYILKILDDPKLLVDILIE